MDRPVQLRQISNFRDVGKTVNRFLGRQVVREGVIFRSARPDAATPEDRTVLRDELRIKTIIDLRTVSEQIQLARQQTLVARSLSSHPPSTRIEGIDYREVRIAGRSFERHVLSQLSWWAFFKVIFFFLLGRRLQARRIVAQAVLVPIGLLGIGIVALDRSGDEICDALSLFAGLQSTPALVHCTFGKDRTGLVCALLLMILGLPITAIEYDYFLTDASLISDRAERIFELREAGLTDEFASTAENMIKGIRHHLDATYGGVDAYLDQIGFLESDRVRLRQMLLV